MIAGRPALTDLAGLDPAVQAAIVLAIEPRLRGLLLYGGRGSGKSAVIDGLLDVLPGGEHVSAVHHWELAAAAERSRLVADGLVLAASDSSEETEDRLGLIVYLPARSIAEDRLAVLSARRDETEARMLGERIAEAQGRLREIAIDPSAARLIAESATALQVKGNRAEYFACLAACACAAWQGRSQPDSDDLQAAVRLVLAPRARALPSAAQNEGERDPGTSAATAASPTGEHTSPGPDPAPSGEQQSSSDAAAFSGEPERMQPSSEDGRLGEDSSLERLIAVARAALPPFVERRPRRQPTDPARRGRALPAVPAARSSRPVALSATIRAALPWQRLRGRQPGERLRVTAGDLRIKRFQTAPRTLTVALVDASGSMAHNRLAEAKGALRDLLRRLYVSRDRLALIAFRGQSARLLLPPGRSLSRAQRAIESLAAGGGTPLEDGLQLALRVVAQARRQAPAEGARLVLLTDGHAAASNGADTWTQLGSQLTAAGVEVVLIDTSVQHLGLYEALDLAASLGARYVPLSRPTATA